MKDIWRILFLVTVCTACCCSELLAQATDLSVSELFIRYRKSAQDSNRVRLLLRIDSLYLYKMPDSSRILDSAVLLAKQASDLSVQIGFAQGNREAMFLLANAYAEKNDFRSAYKLANEARGVQQIHMLIMIGERYVFKPGELPENLDKAYPFIAAAIQRSSANLYPAWHDRAVCLLGKYYFARGNFAVGKKCFLQIIEKYQKLRNYSMEANWWAELGRYYPDRTDTYSEKITSLNRALALFRQLGEKDQEMQALRSLAFIHQLHGNLQLAESTLLRALALRKSIGKRNNFEDYSALAHINNIKGNYNRTLSYALQAVNNVEEIGDKYMAGVVYAQLADAYRSLGDTKKSLIWYTLANENLVGYRIQYRYPISARIVQALIKTGQPQRGLDYITKFARQNPTPRFVDREITASVMADAYRALKRFSLAEQYYKQMILYDEKVRAHFNAQVSVDGIENMVTGAEAYYSIGSFYVQQKSYDLAQYYLSNALTINRYPPSLSRQKDIHFMLFKADSAQGRPYEAIKHYVMHKALNDSLFSSEKVNQIEELLIRYEIAKKQKDLNALRAKEELQAKELQQSGQTRTFAYVLIVVLIILMGVGYSRYNLKQRSNRLLQIKQHQINQANEVLKHILEEKDQLIGEKDVLLDEKAWLLKEIHHRVKNNMQVVISLLNTQSKFVDSLEAKNAIRESTQRMQAMSMIHQKLYHSEGSTLVDMDTYIAELVEYLKGSFRQSGRFQLEIQVDSIRLDVAQALPIGLILNEMITNAFKYAFPGNCSGTMVILMKKADENEVLLEVYDNGVGFPAELSLENSESMGIRLMKGLARQIGEELQITNDKGVHFSIRFKVSPTKTPKPAFETNSIDL